MTVAASHGLRRAHRQQHPAYGDREHNTGAVPGTTVVDVDGVAIANAGGAMVIDVDGTTVADEDAMPIATVDYR